MNHSELMRNDDVRKIYNENTLEEAKEIIKEIQEDKTFGELKSLIANMAYCGYDVGYYRSMEQIVIFDSKYHLIAAINVTGTLVLNMDIIIDNIKDNCYLRNEDTKHSWKALVNEVISFILEYYYTRDKHQIPDEEIETWEEYFDRLNFPNEQRTLSVV